MNLVLRTGGQIQGKYRVVIDAVNSLPYLKFLSIDPAVVFQTRFIHLPDASMFHRISHLDLTTQRSWEAVARGCQYLYRLTHLSITWRQSRFLTDALQALLHHPDFAMLVLWKDELAAHPLVINSLVRHGLDDPQIVVLRSASCWYFQVDGGYWLHAAHIIAWHKENNITTVGHPLSPEDTSAYPEIDLATCMNILYELRTSRKGRGQRGGFEIKTNSRAAGETLQWIFNPTVARCKMAMGRSNGHKVQKWSLRDTKSGRREEVERHKANSGESRGLEVLGGEGERVIGGRSWVVMVVSASSAGGLGGGAVTVGGDGGTAHHQSCAVSNFGLALKAHYVQANMSDITSMPQLSPSSSVTSANSTSLPSPREDHPSPLVEANIKFSPGDTPRIDFPSSSPPRTAHPLQQNKHRFHLYTPPTKTSIWDLHLVSHSLGLSPRSDISLEDLQRGKAYFLSALEDILHCVLRDAYEYKLADRERNMYHVALSTVKIKSIKWRQNLLESIRECRERDAAANEEQIMILESLLGMKHVTIDDTMGDEGLERANHKDGLVELGSVDEEVNYLKETIQLQGRGWSMHSLSNEDGPGESNDNDDNVTSDNDNLLDN
ncbi:hypothetical protein HD554DRAFT_2036068 [Boletus coccyginus]|nr:hypothetical protein HD554DRAFT_2036068 [Boletus coccyginus]